MAKGSRRNGNYPKGSNINTLDTLTVKNFYPRRWAPQEVDNFLICGFQFFQKWILKFFIRRYFDFYISGFPLTLPLTIPQQHQVVTPEYWVGFPLPNILNNFSFRIWPKYYYNLD